ncbi:MAG: nitrous oxide reductase family maturation protein NosD [Leptospiraceae bacterium]|nr:nitrous oxide reductase family maturation protein NosD [Leptospiraceae bacterium]
MDSTNSRRRSPQRNRPVALLVALTLATAGFGFVRPVEGASPELHVCPGCAFTTVHEALERAPAGATVTVHSGYYPEGSLQISKPVTLRGNGYPILDGLGKGHIFYVTAPDVHIQGLTLYRTGVSSVTEFAAIRFHEIHRCSVRDNVILGATYGIYLERSRDCAIERNRIIGQSRSEVSGGNGIHLWYSQEMSIEGNQVEGHRDGLYMEFSENLRIRKNTFEKNIRYGMHFMFSHHNHFHNNVFRKNTTGVAVMYSHDIDVKGNIFLRSWGGAFYGLLLKEISDSYIQGNLIEGNTNGILLDSSNRNLIQGNSFRMNGWAIDVYGNNYGNRITGNSFVGNHFDITTNSRRSENTYDGNYWDRHHGYDGDGDGAGDVPYRPMSVFALWVNRNSELAILMNSPVVDFLEAAERVFPVITPDNMEDGRPLMKNPVRREDIVNANP